MATVINGPQFPMVTRGRPANLGTISASGQAVQFTISAPHGSSSNCPNGTDALTVITTGTLSATVPVLECSLDGGTTWFGIAATSGTPSSTPVTSTTVLTGDTAATSANSYPVSGLSGFPMRFGFNTYTSGSGAVWVGCA